MVVAAATFAMLWSSAARATITQGDFSVFGFLETREEGRWGEGSSTNNGTLTRVSHTGPLPTAIPGRASTETGGSFDFNHWDLDEMRQLADIRPDYHIVKNYKLLGRLDTIFLKDADAFAFYRPWYDAVGTLKNKGLAETNRDFPNYNHRELQQQYFKDDLHEYYAQLNFTDNFSARIGKQQVIWSEADALSGTEVTNTVDATFHGVYGAESPEDVRKNLQMVKLNYILPDFLKTANNEVEAFWIPGDYQGNGINVMIDPRNPWSVPAPISVPGHQAYNQNGQPFRLQTVPNFGAKNMLAIPGLGFTDLAIIGLTPRPSKSLQNSEFGARYSTLIPIGNGLQTSFIYLFEARDDRSDAASWAGPQTFINALGHFAKGFPKSSVIKVAPGQAIVTGAYVFGFPRPGVLKAGTIVLLSDTDYRRNNFFGLTGTYYDKDLTDIVYRYDVLYEPKFGAVSDPHRVSGATDTERLRFIVAGDRPTYIPWLSKQHTFITAQYTNTWYPDRPPGAQGEAVPGLAAGKLRETSNFAFLAITNWLMNGQLTSTNVVEDDIDDNTGAISSSNVYRYSRNVLFGVNSIWFLGRSGRYTDPFLFSRQSRSNLLEFTLTYEI
ncbi:MAG TPA: hypothetical protein VIX59_01530 [Candidatus Binataceae bacterium]